MRKSQGLQAVLGTEDEYHMLAHEATLWRLRPELRPYNPNSNPSPDPTTLTLTLTLTTDPDPDPDH